VKQARGFTLIEVIVAVAVIGLAATALFSLLSTSLFNLRKVEDLHHLQLAGEDLMNRVLLLPALPAPALAQGRLDENNLDARWTVRVMPWIPERLEGNPANAVLKIDVELQWRGRSGERTMKLETVKPAAVAYGMDLNAAIARIIPN
jgi:general secretion pathway protein I